MLSQVKEFYAEAWVDSGETHYCVCKRYWDGGYDVVSAEEPDLATAKSLAEKFNKNNNLN